MTAQPQTSRKPRQEAQPHFNCAACGEDRPAWRLKHGLCMDCRARFDRFGPYA